MKKSSLLRFCAPALLLGATSVTPLIPGSQAQVGQSATRSLLDKAHALEARGRFDMAAQIWTQILLAEPNNTEALGGLAKEAKLRGDSSAAASYLQRLRAISPNDPAIAQVESLQTQQSHNTQLKEAGRLAQQGQYEQSMNLYRQVYGNQPPPGDPALGYYETESATEEGRPHAIAGLRTLVAQFPSDSRYQVALGRILTYNPKTRPEGRRLLEAHPQDPLAVEALRQSLLWDVQNPATAAEIRAYLARHNDAQLAQALHSTPRYGGGGGRPGVPLTAEQRAANAVNATRSAEDRAAYRALNAKELNEAEQRFKAILSRMPDDPNALAGMGYIRMQEANFGGAISFLAQAKQDGSKDPGIDAALNTSRFWYTMGEGAIALNENDLAGAEKNYRSALTMRPQSPEALEGLGGTLLKAQEPQAAIPFFAEFVKVKPEAAHAWRGLFLAQYGAGDSPRALETERRIPGAARAELAKDPLFLRSLASAYSSVGRDADAQRVLKTALDLPFAADAKGVEADTQLQYAGLLQQANHLDQAEGMYRQVVAKEPNNTAAWQGLVRVEHQRDQDAQALETIERMPKASYAQSMREPGFESTVASIYQSQKRLDVAQAILEKALAQQSSAGQKASIPVQIQLAGVYLQRNSPQQAYPLYRKIVTENPDRTDAWKGMLSALHDTGRDNEALAEVRQIPVRTRALLENDVDYLQTVGAVYNALGQPRQAEALLRRVQAHYASQQAMAPADVDIQNAWLLYNGMNDAGLYRQLMGMGDRTDLSESQRRTVQTIWISWAVRRANQAAAAGNNKRALAILNATAQAFPDNPGVLKALAGGYAKAGMPKQAVAIWKAQDMNSAPAADYKAAAGAALAAGDNKDAETWLRFGLEQNPRDAQLLILGAKFEEARGDTNRAAEYYRASLQAMPPSDPGAELATELSHPGPTMAAPLPSASQAHDLASLLAPGQSDAGGVAPAPANAAPYLPGYGNLGAGAPVSGGGQADPESYPQSTMNPAPANSVPLNYGPMNYGPTNSGTGGPAVPSYMSTPHATEPPPAARPRLRDYVPQASADVPVPMDGTELPRIDLAASETGSDLVFTQAVYQHQPRPGSTAEAQPTWMASSQAPGQGLAGSSWLAGSSQARSGQAGSGQAGSGQAGTGQAVSELAVSGRTVLGQTAPGQTSQTASRQTPRLTSSPSGGSDSSGEVYGPYVPYHPPTAVAVRLGDATAQKPASQPEVTDVLPTARYRPNAGSGGAATGHGESNTASAAAARRRRSRTETVKTPDAGQSNPPAEVYTTAPLEPAQYTAQVNSGQTSNGQTYNSSQGQQVPQPGVSGSPAVAPAGVYVAPAQQLPQQTGDSLGQQYPQPNTGVTNPSGTAIYSTQPRSQPRSRTRPRVVSRHAPATAPASAPAELPATEPSYQGLSYPGVGQPLGSQPYPRIGPAYPLGEPPSDADLAAQRLPPLRGPYYTGNTLAPQVALTERQQTERDLATLEGGYSAWLGGTGSARYRSGTIGLDRLTDLEATFEASATVGNHVRLTVVPRAVFLSSGQLNTANSLIAAPLLGTLPGNAAVSPANQSTNGVGGEIQLATRNFAAAAGYTPYEFLVRNITGRVLFKPNQHVTFFGDRSPVEETQLSYAGLRDPGSATPVYTGNIWGGVISSGGGVRFDMGDERAGFYISADGADLSGYHVLENYKFEGSMGAYFLAHTFPGYGRINVGGLVYGEHYNYNELGMTYGLGGYFSPQAYLLVSVPVTFTGRYGSNFHYTVAGSLGVQTFQEASQIYFPLDRGLQNGIACTNVQLATQSCGLNPAFSNTGGNYSINSEGAYRVAEHWYAGGFVTANNTNNYNTASGGFFVRYMFRPQYANDDLPTGLFPVQGFRPLRVP